MALGKDTSDVRLTETQSPLKETTGSEGFGAIAAARDTLAGALDASRKTKAAVANGELVNEFLAQRVEASLETEGFEDLSGDAKDQVIRGLGEFDRHLTQVVESGGNKFTKASILRTRRAMDAIAENPANAEAVIKAAGLADKVATPLANLLKEEEEARIQVKKDVASGLRTLAVDNGIILDEATLLDDDAVISAGESHPEFALVRSTAQLQAKAKNMTARQDASEIQRVAAVTSEIPVISRGILDVAIQAGQAGSSAGETILAIEQKTAQDIAQVESEYPFLSLEERKHIRSTLEDSKRQAIAYVKGDLKLGALDLYMRNLNIEGKKQANHAARRNNVINDQFQAKQASADLMSTQQGLVAGGLKLSQDYIDAMDSSSPFMQSLYEANPDLKDRTYNYAVYAVQGNLDEMERQLLDTGTPTQRAGVALNGLKSVVRGETTLAEMQPEIVQNMVDNLARGMAKAKAHNPSEYRAIVKDAIDFIGTNEELQGLMKAAPELMAPLAQPMAEEVRSSVQGSILDVGKRALTGGTGTSVFNAQGTENIFDAFSNTVMAGLRTTQEALAKKISGDDSPATRKANEGKEAALQRMSSALTALQNPTQQVFYNNIGAFMVIDEDAIASDGAVQFKISDDASELIEDANFKAQLQAKIRRLNALESPRLTEELRVYNLTQGYDNPFHGYEEIMFNAGDLDVTNFIPRDSQIGRTE